MSNTTNEFSTLVNTIESSYEFCLAYAAQGRDQENPAGGNSEVRAEISALSEALINVGQAAVDHIKNNQTASDASSVATDLLAQDASKASVMVQMVLASNNISSPLIDNLNASSHLRCVLTDLFLIDEATSSNNLA